MADEPRSKSEIELAIKDSMSESLRTIGREMVATNLRAQEMASSSSGFGNLDKFITSMTDKLVSPIGLVGAFVATGKALDTFVAGQLQLQNFARDTGFAVKEVQNYRQQLGLLGVPADQANTAIGRLGANIQSAMAVPWANHFVTEIMKTNAPLAVRIQTLVNTGQQVKVSKAIYDEYIKSNDAGKAALTRAAQMSHTEILALGIDTTGLIKAWDQLPGAELEYNRITINLAQTQENIWKNIASNAVRGIVQITGGWDGMDATARKVVNFINVEVNKAFVDFTVILKDIRAFIEWLESRGPQGQMSTEGIPTITWQQRLRGTGPRRQFATDLFKEGQYQLEGEGGESDAELFKGGRYQLQGEGGVGSELIIIQKDSKGHLLDIRDILKKMWDRSSLRGRAEGGPVEAGEEYEVGERGPEKLLDASGQSQVVGKEGPEVIRPEQSGRVMPWNVSDPQNILGTKAAENRWSRLIPSAVLEAAQTVKQADPDARTWLRKQLGLEGAFGFQDKPGEPAPWAPGGEWSGRGQIASGAGLREKDTPDWGLPRSLQSREEGTPAWPDPNLPSEIMAEARKAALVGGPGAVQQYIRQKGYEVHSAWCGDFAKTVVESAGGTAPANAQVASNWRNFGSQVVTPEEGDIAVQRSARGGGGYVKTGSTGSHVTVVDALDPARGSFTGLGGNQSQARSQFRTGGYEFFRGQEAGVNIDERQRLTESLKSMNASKPTLTADIRFKNVPPGVETMVDGDNIDKLKVTKEKRFSGDFAPTESGMAD